MGKISAGKTDEATWDLSGYRHPVVALADVMNSRTTNTHSQHRQQQPEHQQRPLQDPPSPQPQPGPSQPQRPQPQSSAPPSFVRNHSRKYSIKAPIVALFKRTNSSRPLNQEVAQSIPPSPTSPVEPPLQRTPSRKARTTDPQSPLSPSKTPIADAFLRRRPSLLNRREEPPQESVFKRLGSLRSRSRSRRRPEEPRTTNNFNLDQPLETTTGTPILDFLTRSVSRSAQIPRCESPEELPITPPATLQGHDDNPPLDEPSTDTPILNLLKRSTSRIGRPRIRHPPATYDAAANNEPSQDSNPPQAASETPIFTLLKRTTSLTARGRSRPRAEKQPSAPPTPAASIKSRDHNHPELSSEAPGLALLRRTTSHTPRTHTPAATPAPSVKSKDPEPSSSTPILHLLRRTTSLTPRTRTPVATPAPSIKGGGSQPLISSASAPVLTLLRRTTSLTPRSRPTKPSDEPPPTPNSSSQKPTPHPNPKDRDLPALPPPSPPATATEASFNHSALTPNEQSRKMPPQTALSKDEQTKVMLACPKGSCKILTATHGRIYYAYPDPTTWTYIGQEGAIALVFDKQKEAYYFRMVDLKVRGSPFRILSAQSKCFPSVGYKRSYLGI